MYVGYRYEGFLPGEMYHVCSRGVEQRKIFLNDRDHLRFLSLLHHCLPVGPIQSYSVAKRLKRKSQNLKEGEGLVDVLVYCLMSNHFHLLVRENVEAGVTRYFQRLLNSYARYFNVKYRRSGSLFAGPFRAVAVDGDEYLLHVSRYIHLNPYVASMVHDPFSYRWSSLGEYTGDSAAGDYCHTAFITGLVSPADYKKFVADQADYAREIEGIKHLVLE